MNLSFIAVIVLFVLMLMFASYAQKCFARSVAYWRIKFTKISLGNIAFGIICLAFSLVILGLSIEILNGNLINFNESDKKMVLFGFGGIVVVIGLVRGVFTDLVKFKEAEEKE